MPCPMHFRRLLRCVIKLLIHGAVIVTMSQQNEVIEKGSIVIDDNRFSYVGPTEWTPPGPFDRTIDADGMIAMPGMVNAHCHSPRISCAG